MKISDIKNMRVTVMGIGLHGGSVELIRWLLDNGARVTATDIKRRESLELSLKKLEGYKNLKIVVGQHRPEDFEKADLVIKNPTVPWKNKYIQKAVKNNIPVEMDSSLFFQFCPSKKIIGVTGTKGKTTTASLIAAIFKKAGLKTVRVGVGQEPVMNKLKKIDKDTWVVFELSSWRLSGIKKIKKSPSFAVITNILPDHLNHYESMEAYAKDKEIIFQFQKPDDKLVLNWDNEAAKNCSEKAAGEKIFFSMNENIDPVSAYVSEGEIIYKNQGEEEKVMDIKKIRLRGAHNISNTLAAVAVAREIGIKPAVIRSAIEEFSGVKHRLEYVGKIAGKYFYNDTTATTPDSAIAAINSFLKPVILIAGGSDKKLDLEKFAKKIAKSKTIKKVAFLEGAATEKLMEMVKENGGEDKIIDIFSNISDAVKATESAAAEGDVILLSPGCASFGMFENEFDRGRKFKEEVEGVDRK